MFRLVFACAWGVLAELAPMPATAEPLALTGAAIRETFSGSTIHLDTPLAATVPIHYLDSGQVTGEAGNLSWVLGAATDKGRWWVERDRLCHRWSVWFEAQNQCLRLSIERDRLFWVRDDGKTGTATMVSRLRSVDQSQTIASLTPVTVPVTLRLPSPPPAQTLAAVPMQAASLPPSAKPKTVPAVKRQPSSVARSALPVANRAATSSVAIVPTFMVAGVDENDVLYVREGPSMEHASVGALPPQAQGVTILGNCQQAWCLVAHHGIKGWVNAYYLAAQDPVVLPVLVQSRASERR